MNRDVWLRVEGALLERLLEKALEHGAAFARIRRSGARSLLVQTDAHSAAILLDLCRKYGLNACTLRRGGISRLRDVLRRRWTLLPAMLLSMLLCALLLSRVWLVDIRFADGQSNPVLERSITACLKACGVRPGMAASDLDPSGLQSRLIARVDGLSYAGIRLQGVRLLVEASPESPPPGTYVRSRKQDLLASRDGVVESITVYSGQACVQPGDTVLAGEVLIRGAEAKTKEETTSVGARGEVIARCWYEGSAEGSLQNIRNTRTGRSSTGCRLRLGGFSLPLIQAQSFSRSEVETRAVPVVGLFVPLELEHSTHYEIRRDVYPVDRKELEHRLQILARASAMQQLAAENIEYEIASEWTDLRENQNTLQIHAVLEIFTDIAVPSDAFN